MAKKKNGDALVTFDMLTEFYHELIRPQLDRIEKAVHKNNDDIQILKSDTQELKVKVDHLDDQFDGLKAEFSNVPSRKEFNELKTEVRSIAS